MRRLFWLVLLPMNLSIVTAQTVIEASGPSIVNSCQLLNYSFRLRTPVEGQTISFRFSEPIAYIDNTLSDEVTIYSDGIDIVLNGFGGCDVITGRLSIIPQSINYLEPFEMIYSIDESLDEPKKLESFVRRSFVDMSFDPYRFDAATNVATKALVITNITDQDLSTLNISVDVDNDFAKLVSTNIGEIVGDTILTISSDHLIAAGVSDGLLSKGESIELTLSYFLNSCDIRSISYTPYNACLVQSDEEYSYVDENVSEQISLVYSWSDLSNLKLGYCNYEYSDILIWLDSDSIEAVELSEAYDISVSIDKLPFQSNNVFACMDAALKIGDQVVQAEVADGGQFLFSLNGLITEPLDLDELQDLDNDGSYDDLAFGDTLRVSIGARVSEACSGRPYGVGAMNGLITSSYMDRCENEHLSNTESFGVDGTIFLGTSVPEFSRDSRDEKFFVEGSSVTQRIVFVYNEGYIPTCGSETDLEFVIESPSFLSLANEGHIAIRNRTDTIDIDPIDMTDSIVVILPIAPSWTIITNYSSSYDDTDGPDNEVSCGDCVFSDLQFMQARYRMICDQQDNCSLPNIDRRSSNGPFKISCGSSNSTGQIVHVDSVRLDRLNTQWRSSERMERIDPDDYPLTYQRGDMDVLPGIVDSLPGNVFFFESDTLRSRYYMTIACTDLLESFNVSLRFQQNTTQTNLKVLESRLINRLTGEDIDVAAFTSQTSQDLVLRIDNSSLLETGSWQWYLTGTIDMNSDFVFSTSYVNQPLRYSLVESSVNGCELLVDRQEHELRLSEYFVERLFEGTAANNFGTWKYSLGRRFNYGPVLHPNQFTFFQSNALSEFREYPNIQTITYSLPKGFIIRDDLFRIQAYRIASSSFNFEDVHEDLDRQVFLDQTYSPSAIIVEEDYTHYQFDVGGDYNVLPIGSFSFGSADIMSVGVPDTPISTLYISGTLLYKDHSQGTLQDISFDFQDSTNLIFDDYNLQFDDDFRIIDNDTVQTWSLLNHVDGSSSLNFTFRELGNSLSALNDDYSLTLHVEGIEVDSIAIIEEITDSPFDLGSYTLSKETDNSWIIRDTSYYFLSNPDIELYTSSYDCGYDTLLVQYYPSNVDTTDCAGCVWRDTLVSYQPTGYPELNLNLSPNQLTNCESEFFEYRLENIGEGLLTNIQLSIASNIYEQLEVEYRDTSGSYQAALISVDTAANLMRWNLGENDLDKLAGLNERSGLSGVDVRLRYTGACITTESAYLTAWSTSETRCGDLLRTDILSLTEIPVVIRDDLDYDMRINKIQESECAEQLNIEIVIDGNSDEILENPSLRVLLPEEFAYIIGTSTLNGIDIADPIVQLERDQIVLIWSDDLDAVLSDSIILAFDIDIRCSNICIDAMISASLISEVNNSCSTDCNPRAVRAFLKDEPLPMSPLFIFREIHTDILGRDDAGNLMLSLDVDIKQNNALVYNPPIEFDVFFDANGNNSLDLDEQVLFTSDYGLADYEYSDITLDEILSIPEEFLCQLVMEVNIGDCACYALTHLIEPDPTVSLNDQIYTCGNDELLLYGLGWGTCTRVWDDHEQIDLTDPDKPRYIVSPELVTDTLFARLDCFGCPISDTIVIIVGGIDSQIDLIYPEDCSGVVSAEFSILNDIPIAEIVWEGYTDTTSIVNGISGDSITVSYTTIFGCSNTVSVAIDQSFFQSQDWRITVSNASPQPGEQFSLSIEGVGPNDSISWRVSTDQIICENCQEINLEVTQDQYVYASIISKQGCSFTDSIWIDVISDSHVYVPNGFTPNGDGVNDLFYPSFNDGVVDVLDWSIYDRWGKRVYFNQGTVLSNQLAWNGNIASQIASEGIYMYSLEIQTSDGTVLSFHGSLSLIR